MIPFMIVVTCLAGCSAGMPDLGRNEFATRADCDKELMRIAKDWRPPKSAYTFRCRPFPW